MNSRFSVLMIAAAAGLTPVGASAQEQAAPSAVADTSVTPFDAAARVGNAELRDVTGRSDLAQVVNAQNKGVVSGNTVSGQSQTGTIRFDSSSFQNLNGLSLLSANTGNNVSINSSLNVNVAISNR